MEDAFTDQTSLSKQVTYPRYACLSSNALKIIAMILMTADHLAWVFQDSDFSRQWWVILIHIFGRIVAPIFWFMMAEGWHFTKKPKLYIIRLAIGTFISHFAYALFTQQSFIPFVVDGKLSYAYQTSVMWGLLWAAVALYLTDERYFHNPKWAKILIYIAFGIVAFPCDWSACGYLAIILLYKSRSQSFWKRMILMMVPVVIFSACYCIYADWVYGLIALAVALSIPLLRLYNGKPGQSKAMKGLYYLYYPIHLTILGLIELFLL